MFDLDASKIVIVGVAALIFIPPKDLPRVLRQAGQFVGKMKRMANEFQGQFMDAMREADMADLRKEANKLSDAVRIDAGLPSVHDIGNHMHPLPAAKESGPMSNVSSTSDPSGYKPATDTVPASAPAALAPAPAVASHESVGHSAEAEHTS